jgi:uncharacterized protein YajQ (UPF0234 family)
MPAPDVAFEPSRDQDLVALVRDMKLGVRASILPDYIRVKNGPNPDAQ